MILPTKHLSQHRALLSVGAEILRRLDEPTTVSRLWEEMKFSKGNARVARLSFDWFVLALDWLFIVNTIDLKDGRIIKRRSAP